MNQYTSTNRGSGDMGQGPRIQSTIRSSIGG